MAFDWTEESDGGTRAEKIPAGQAIPLKIVKVLRAKPSTGEEFTSNGGDPQLMIVFADAEGREASATATLSEKAAWVLRDILRAAGADMAAMNKAGVTPQNFEDQGWASKSLVGRKLLADVAWKQKGEKEYSDIKPVMAQPGQRQPAPPPQRQSAPPPQRQPAAAAAGNGAGKFNPEGNLAGDAGGFKDDDIPFARPSAAGSR